MHFSMLMVVVMALVCSIVGAESGFTDYIIALKSPADDTTFQQAREDIEGMGGKVTYEIKRGSKGLIASLPSDQVTTMDAKDYVDFVEQDKAVHASR